MSNQAPQTGNHTRIAMICGGLALSMLVLAFASVPLYDLFCRVTGYGGTTQRAEQAADRVVDRVMEIRFDANVAGKLGWSFKPEQRTVKVKVGESTLVHYVAQNTSDAAAMATATFNVSPPAAGAYFNKLECFCFTEQRLEPGEKIDMPVVFFLDPAMMDEDDLDGVSSVTLSYTFFPIDDDEQKTKPVAALAGENQAKPL